MGTETLRPIGNINSVWVEYAYTTIDDAVTQPTSGGNDLLTLSTGETDEQQYTLTTPAGTDGNVTSVDVWIFARTDNTSDDFPAEVTFKIRSNGVWYTAASANVINTNDTTCTWYSRTITASMGAISTMSPALGIVPFVDKYCDLKIDVVYVVVNYSATSPSTYALGLLLDL
jgi:hypothetical protein